MNSHSVAVLIPCLNEAPTISRVVEDFSTILPQATIYVYDNGSNDDTRSLASATTAVVRDEPRRGKGNVVRRMFSDVEADVYILVDGDGTYDPEVAPTMISFIVSQGIDMVVATRQGVYFNAHRTGHGLGNRVFNYFYRRVFGNEFNDIFSGYRAFTRRFVKSFPATSIGFEIETEMSVYASQLRLPTKEIPTKYKERSADSPSKLNTVRDALRILRMMALLYKEARPAQFFGLIAASLSVLAALLGIPVLETFFQTGLVPRFPTAILTMVLAVLSGIFLTCGLILDSVARGRLEQRRLTYLAHGGPIKPSQGQQPITEAPRYER